ncbi:MAG: GntR family transcriptional regulator, galactonate operon transcriptional repressor [Solirubrobacteraceae bacterium]|jgi:DNA-binding FadR family transcriptional regulator|nr:GntR family transcriptional regulator, galactonate operon transcriptional repressor [Solirubrobacteraceae bacterium]
MPNVYDEPMSKLLDAIARGDIAPGAQLPREVDLAAHLKISRGSVRTMLQELVGCDVVHVTHGRGQFVRPTEDWNVLDDRVMTAILDTRNASRLLAEILETRLLIEVAAAGLAAQRATLQSITELDAAAERMRDALRTRRATGSSDYLEAEAHFERTLAAAAGNRPLHRSLAPLQRATRIAGINHRRRRKALLEHEDVLDAIKNSDPGGAQDAMRTHLEAIAADLPRAKR